MKLGLFCRPKSKEVSNTHLAAKSGMSLGSVHTTIKLLKLQLYKITIVQRFTNPGCGTRIWFYKWVQINRFSFLQASPPSRKKKSHVNYKDIVCKWEMFLRMTTACAWQHTKLRINRSGSYVYLNTWESVCCISLIVTYSKKEKYEMLGLLVV